MALNRYPGMKGFTLIEVIVAMSLAVSAAIFLLGVYIQFQSAVSIKKGHRQFVQKTSAFSQALYSQLTTAKGIIYLSESEIRLIREVGDTLSYFYDSDSLKIGIVYFPYGIQRFKVGALGPAYRIEDAYGFETTENHPLAEFDDDDSGVLEFEELDTDGNMVLEGRECIKIGVITVDMVFRNNDDTTSFQFSAHPRNRIHIPTEEELYNLEL